MEQQLSPLEQIKKEENLGLKTLLNKYSEYKYIQLSSAKYEILLKILDLFRDLNIISIKNSEILTSTSGFITHVNLSSLIPSEFEFHIVNPKKFYNLLKLFKKNSEIIILDDDPNSRFIVSNGDLKLFLPKPINSSSLEIVLPNTAEGEIISHFSINKEFANAISELSKNSSYINYLVKDGDIKAISVPNLAIYVLDKFKGEDITEETADMCLRTTHFCSIPSETYEIWVMYKNDVEYQHYLAAIKQIVLGIEIITFEELEVNSNENFIL